jgi:hypothetical protein
MPFEQHYYGSIGNVINSEGAVTVDGRVVLSKESGAQDLIRELLLMK